MCGIAGIVGRAAARTSARTRSGARTYVQDLGSRNGTCVGGVPINGEFPLRPGEEFTVGSTSVTSSRAQ